MPTGAAHGVDQGRRRGRRRQHTPKVAFVAPPQDYLASSGKQISPADIDLNVRALSMGKLHHAMMGTAAVAIGTGRRDPGTWSTWRPAVVTVTALPSVIHRAH